MIFRLALAVSVSAVVMLSAQSVEAQTHAYGATWGCLLYTSDAADE